MLLSAVSKKPFKVLTFALSLLFYGASSLRPGASALPQTEPSVSSAAAPGVMNTKTAVTGDSGIESLRDLKRSYRIPGFRLGGVYTPGQKDTYASGGVGGTTLESLGADPLKLSYIAVGTPQYNARGGITNAVIVNSYYSGDAALMYHYWYADQAGNAFAQGAVVGPGKLIDTQKYYVVFLDALGLWGASKPSEGLGQRFPKYTLFDMVQANYRLLRDHLKVDQVVLSIGPSMGGMQTYLWPLLHPGFVNGILPIGGSANTQSDPIVRDLFQLMTAAIESDPVWRQTRGAYYDRPKAEHPNQGVEFGWSIISHTGTGFDHQFNQGWEAKQKDTFVWGNSALGSNLKAKSRAYDANDLLYRNQALFTFDIRPYLSRIKVPTLILHVQNDQWLRVQNAQFAHQQIAGSRLLTFSDPLAHYAIFKAPQQFTAEIASFLKGL